VTEPYDLPAPHDAARVANRLIQLVQDYNDREENGRYDILVYVRDTQETPGMSVNRTTRKSSTRMNFEGASSYKEVLVELTNTLRAAIERS
jgi:hypothetical protein